MPLSARQLLNDPKVAMGLIRRTENDKGFNEINKSIDALQKQEKALHQSIYELEEHQESKITLYVREIHRELKSKGKTS